MLSGGGRLRLAPGRRRAAAGLTAALFVAVFAASASRLVAQERRRGVGSVAAPQPTALARTVSATPSAMRFNSVFPSIHDAVTAAGFAGVPISRSMLRLVQRSNRQRDIASVELIPTVAALGKRLVPSAAYRHDEHFDRPAHLSHADAYAASMRVVERQTSSVVELIGAGEHEAAARVLGRVLHAWQDLAAHSNIAFLVSTDGAAPAADGAIPDGLRITSYDRHAADPERPDDPLGYTHGAFALDHARKNAFAATVPAGSSRSHHELAVRAATGLTQRSVAAIARSVGERYSPDAWARFLGHDARHTTGAWTSAAVVHIDGAHAGARVGRRITELAPDLEAGLGAFTDGRVQVGLQLGTHTFGPRFLAFARIDHTLSGGGISYGGGVDVRVIDRAWLPDLRVAGDSDRGMLVGLATRF